MIMPKLIPTEQLEKASKEQREKALTEQTQATYNRQSRATNEAQMSRAEDRFHEGGGIQGDEEYGPHVEAVKRGGGGIRAKRALRAVQQEPEQKLEKWQPKTKVSTARGRKQREGYSNVGQHSGRQSFAHGYVEQMKKGDTPMVTDEQQRLDNAAVQLEKIFGIGRGSKEKGAAGRERAVNPFGAAAKRNVRADRAAKKWRETETPDASPEVKRSKQAAKAKVESPSRRAAAGRERIKRAPGRFGAAAADVVASGARAAGDAAVGGARATGRGVRRAAEAVEPAGVQRARGGGPAARAQRGSDFEAKPTGSEGPPGRSFGSKLRSAFGAAGRNIASGAKEFGAGLKEGTEDVTRPFIKPSGGESVPVEPSSGSRAPKTGFGGGAPPGAAKSPTKVFKPSSKMEKAMISLQKISEGRQFEKADPDASPAEKGRRNLEAQKTRAMRAEKLESTDMPFTSVMPGTPNTPQARRAGTKAYNLNVRSGTPRESARGVARAARHDTTAGGDNWSDANYTPPPKRQG